MTNKPVMVKPPPDATLAAVPIAEDIRPVLADAAPLTATEAARDVLGDYLAYASFIAHGNPMQLAVQWTGAPLEVHAARLAAELLSVLADNAALRADGPIR